VPSSALEKIVDEVERYVIDSAERERSTVDVGELIMQRLIGIDPVAYVRFASVYRDFKDASEFKVALEQLNSEPHASRAGQKLQPKLSK
jgi:transcriptional repressor NrdR